MDVKEYLKSLSQMDREKLGHMAGRTGAYVTSIIYKKGSTASLPLAVAIDKMSNGAVDFRNVMSRNDGIDWDYIKEALKRRG
jgi:hypothetical protein